MSNYHLDPILMRRVKKVIDRWDPIGLLRGGAPEDEYDHETDDITLAFQKTNNADELALAIKERFIRAFDERIFTKDYSQCLIVARRIISDDSQINIGDWVYTSEPGIWRIERIIDFFYESRYSLIFPKVENISPLVIAKRLLDANNCISYSVESFNSILMLPLSTEEKKQVSHVIDNKQELEAFDNYKKSVNTYLELSFTVDKNALEFFDVLIENLFAYKIEKGMTNDEILSIIEKGATKKIYNGLCVNKSIKFTCYNCEVNEGEFIYRSYKISNI